MKTKKTDTIINVINSVLIAFQLIIAFITFRYVIVPGAELLAKDQTITELSSSIDSLNVVKTDLQDSISETREQKRLLERRVAELESSVESQTENLNNITQDLFNAEMTILIGDLLPYLKKVKGNSDLVEHSNKALQEGIDNIIISNNRRVNDEVEAPPENLYSPPYYYGFYLTSLEQIDRVQEILSEDIEKTEFYLMAKEFYSYQSKDFDDALDSYMSPDLVSEDTTKAAIGFVGNRLDENRHFIDHINDSAILGLKLLWNEYQDVVRSYAERIPSGAIMNYAEYLRLWSSSNPKEREGLTKQWEYAESLKNGLKQELSELPDLYTYLRNECFSHSDITEEILLDEVEGLLFQ